MYQHNFKLLFLLISMVLLLVIPVSAVENFKTSSYGAGHQIWFEAEDFDDRNPNNDFGFAMSDEPNDFGKSITNTSGDDGEYMLRYDFDISKAGGSGGTWYFWGRVINPTGRSSFMLVEGHPGDPMPVTIPMSGLTGKMRIFEDHIGSTWTWANDTFHDAHTKTLRDGMNTMYILAREDEGQMDVFMWTDDPNYVPKDADYKNAKVTSKAPASSPSPTSVAPQLDSAAQTDAAVPVVKTPVLPPGTRPRVIATTDGEVDDRSSMIRFLLYSFDFDVVGIVQVNSKFQKKGHSDKKWIEAQFDAYEQVLSNLRKHNPNYPDAGQLRSVLRVGNENVNDLWIAPPDMETKNTPGEQLIIDTLLDDDPRPVHVLSWGGANTTASALWKLKTEYPKEKFEYAASRIRIYCIWYQDGGGKWIQENIPEAYINEAYRWDNVWDYESYDHARKQGKMSSNPPFVQEYMKPAWLNEHVKTGHGPLGAMTPQKYISEGDTPSFLHLVNNGLDSHLDYTLGGWGGRSVYDDPAFPNHITDKAIKDDDNRNKMYWRWVPAAQNDFAARMDWCVKEFKEANHAPVAEVKGALTRDVKAGETVKLAATATDPDGDKLTCKWWQYADADSAAATVTITNSNSLDNASFVVPNEPGKQVHIILEVTDDGTPELKYYQRVIVTINQ